MLDLLNTIAFYYIIILILVKLFQSLLRKFGRTFFNSSFNEGNSTNTLEIISSEKNNLIEKSEFLLTSFEDLEEKKFIYKLNFENKLLLNNFKSQIETDQNILKISTSFN